MSMIAYPLNNIDYSAEDAELFHCTRSSGVFLEDDFSATVTGADNQVTVGQGIAWIRNSRFSGKVLAQKEAVTLDLDLPDSTRPRIDAVIIQFSANLNAASVVVKHGAPASSPVPPEVVQTEALYELHLYHVRRSAGAATVTAGDVTDLRLDPKYCGLMADAAHRIDTSVINAQIDAFIQQLQKRIDGVSDGAMFESSAYPGCYYRVVDGEQEWLNPPMMYGVEYRTAERSLGSAVYTKWVSFALPTGQRTYSVKFEECVSNPGILLSCSGHRVVGDVWTALPHITSEYCAYFTVSNGTITLSLSTGTFDSEYIADELVVVLKYKKS